MKLLALLLSILLLFVSQLSRAACEVQTLKSGEASPCAGWYVSEPIMQEMTQNKKELELSRKLIETQKHLNSLNNDEIEFYKTKSTNLAKELDKAETKRFWATAGAFVLGVAITGLAAKVAIESAK